MMIKGFVKRGGLGLGLLIVFILSCSWVHADDLHSEWHYSGDTFTVDGEVIKVNHYDFYDTTVILDVDDNTYILSEGECKQLTNKEYCIDDIFKDLESADEDDPIKFEGGEIYAGVRVIIRTRGPDIGVSRDFSTTRPEINEDVIVTVTVENEGNEGAYSFIYTEAFPENVLVTASSSSTERRSRSITYTTKSLLPDSEKIFTYRFRVSDYIEFSIKPEASYTFGGEQYPVSISGKTVKVERPYDYKATLAPSTIEATDQTALSLRIDNSVSDEVSVSQLKIIIPPSLSVQTKPGELDQVEGDYYWNGTIASDKFKLINFLLKPIKSGNYKILTSINVTDSGGKKFYETKNVTLNSEIKKIEPILSVIDTSVSEGSAFRVAFSVRNPNKRVGLKNINARIVSPVFPDQVTSLDALDADKTVTLLVNDTLTAPFLDEQTKYDIEVLGTYETSTNEEFEFSTKEVLTVSPVSEAVSIIQEADKKNVDAGNDVAITVKIKNNNEEAIKVNVFDSYPAEEATLIGGKTSGSVYFDKAGTKEVYTYKLKTPVAYNETNVIKIKTTAALEEKNYMDDKTMEIKVIPLETVEEEEVKEEEEKEEEPVPPPKKEEEEEPGFFQKIINAVTDFFRNLLGLEGKKKLID